MLKRSLLLFFLFLLNYNTFAETEMNVDDRLPESMEKRLSPLPETKVKYMPKTPYQKTMTLLKAGNTFYSKGVALQKKDKKYREPKALALFITDIEPNNAPDILFNQKEPLFYTVRIPGVILTPLIIEGIEHTLKRNPVPLIILMEQTHDELLAQACAGFHFDFSPNLIARLQKAVTIAKTHLPGVDCFDVRMAEYIAKQNMLLQLKSLKRNSPYISKLIKNKEVKLIGAMLEASTQKVYFFETPS